MTGLATYPPQPAPADCSRAAHPALIVAATLLLLQAGIVAVNLTPLIERYTVSDLLDVNGEANLPSWLSASALLAIAAAAGLAAWADRLAARPRPLWRGWALIAGLFVLLSADEAAGLHELIGEKVHRIVQIEALPSLYSWVLVVAPLGLVTVIFLIRWLAANLGFGSPTARLALEAIALWLAVPVLEALDPTHGGPRLLSVFEETLEVGGEALFLAGVILYLGMPGRLSALASHLAKPGHS